MTRFLAIAALTIAVSGCALGSAALKSGDEKSVVRTLQDANAGRAVRARMLRAHGFELGGVDVEAAEGVLVLSGRVPRMEDRIEAERIAWSAPNISEVGNELRVGDAQGLSRNVRDGWLEKSVRTRLFADGDVRGRNLNVETHDGTVYLLGVARDQAELREATRIASTTRGARNVVSYVHLADGGNVSSRPRPAPVSVAELPQAPVYTAPEQSVSPRSYRDPDTGEVLELAPGTVVVPVAPGTPVPDAGGAPFYIDPDSGERIPVRYVVETPKL